MVHNQCGAQALCFHKAVPLRGPEAACTEEVPDGTGSRQLGIPGIKHHAEIFGDHCWLSAVLHLIKRHQANETRLQVLQQMHQMHQVEWRHHHYMSSPVPPDKQRGWCRSSPHREWLGSAAESCAWSCPTLPRTGRKFCSVTNNKRSSVTLMKNRWTLGSEVNIKKKRMTVSLYLWSTPKDTLPIMEDKEKQHMS